MQTTDLYHVADVRRCGSLVSMHVNRIAIVDWTTSHIPASSHYLGKDNARHPLLPTGITEALGADADTDEGRRNSTDTDEKPPAQDVVL